MSNIQKKTLSLVENSKFQIGIISLIIINAVTLGVGTSKSIMSEFGHIINIIDGFIISCFLVEIALKLIAYRFKFFLKPWNVFDLTIVSIALVPTTGSFTALRALRVLMILRLVSTIKSMRRVIEGLISAIPGIISVSSIIILFFYIFAVIGTHLYGPAFPQWFGDLGKTMFTLFQVMTLESWSMGIVRPLMEEFPSAWLFFVMYILVTTFTMLNLFIAIIVSAMDDVDKKQASLDRENMKKEILNEIKDLKKSLNTK